MIFDSLEEKARVEAALAFVDGAPIEALQPGALMRSFRALIPGGEVTDVLTLAIEHERVKAENLKLQDDVMKAEMEAFLLKRRLESMQPKTQ